MNGSASANVARPPSDRRIGHFLPDPTKPRTKSPMGGLNPYSPLFDQLGNDFLQQLINHCGLKPHHKVIELGCGTGRIAKPLLSYLKTGTYTGIDIHKGYVDYCNQTLNGGTFIHWNIKHDEYNENGSIILTDAHLELTGFDLAISIGVFNHLKTSEVCHCVRELSRTLKSRGKLYCTLILLNQLSLDFIKHQSVHPWFYEVKDSDTWYEYDHRPFFSTAQPEPAIRRVFIKSGLMIKEPINYGQWCKTPRAVISHDVIVATRGQWI